MRMSLDRPKLIAAGALLFASTALVAEGTRFSDFTPFTSSGVFTSTAACLADEGQKSGCTDGRMKS